MFKFGNVWQLKIKVCKGEYLREHFYGHYGCNCAILPSGILLPWTFNTIESYFSQLNLRWNFCDSM